MVRATSRLQTGALCIGGTGMSKRGWLDMPSRTTQWSRRPTAYASLQLPGAAHRGRSPGRFASGRTRQLSRELLPAAMRRENQELKPDAPSGHGLAVALEVFGENKCRSR
jgi:hypothetical protein